MMDVGVVAAPITVEMGLDELTELDLGVDASQGAILKRTCSQISWKSAHAFYLLIS